MAIGINSYEQTDIKNYYYNTLSFYDHKLNLVNEYKKVKLVPFGEFLPFEKILKKLGLKSLTNNYQSFSSGDHREILLVDENNFDLKILPLICYEIIYSGNIFTDSDFDYIVNISEDGWFGNSIGPHQHFAHSIFRAIESGKYLLRSANNGISAIITNNGTIVDKIDKNISGVINSGINFTYKRSLYNIFGHYIPFIFAIIMVVTLFIIDLCSKRKKY